MNMDVVATLLNANGQYVQLLMSPKDFLTTESLPEGFKTASFAEAVGQCHSTITVPAVDIGLPLFFTETVLYLSQRKQTVLDDGVRGTTIKSEEMRKRLAKGTCLPIKPHNALATWRNDFAHYAIPTLNRTFVALNNLHNQHFDSTDIINIVEHDPIAVAQIKRIAFQSRNFQQRSTAGIISINDAVSNILGAERARNFLMFISMKRCLLMEYMQEQDLNIHTDRAFQLSEVVDATKSLPALLFDFAYLAVSEFIKIKFKHFQGAINLNPYCPTPLIYEKLLGATNTEITADFLRKWNIEPVIIDEISNQYSPDSCIFKAKKQLIKEDVPFSPGEVYGTY